MKKWNSRHNALAAVSTVTAAAMLTACGGAASSSAASSAASQADSAASSGEASSAAESWGDVKLTMWGAEEDQTMLREMADAFIAENADKGNITIEIGVQSESSAKDTVLADPESAADVFAMRARIRDTGCRGDPGSPFHGFPGKKGSSENQRAT